MTTVWIVPSGARFPMRNERRLLGDSGQFSAVHYSAVAGYFADIIEATQIAFGQSPKNPAVINFSG